MQHLPVAGTEMQPVFFVRVDEVQARKGHHPK